MLEYNLNYWYIREFVQNDSFPVRTQKEKCEKEHNQLIELEVHYFNILSWVSITMQKPFKTFSRADYSNICYQ